jgi:hypothetical protein
VIVSKVGGKEMPLELRFFREIYETGGFFVVDRSANCFSFQAYGLFDDRLLSENDRFAIALKIANCSAKINIGRPVDIGKLFLNHDGSVSVHLLKLGRHGGPYPCATITPYSLRTQPIRLLPAPL